jgi:hypothetical protein
MTPYQKHMAFNRFASSVIDKDTLAERRKMEALMKRFIRNKKYSRDLRLTHGADWVQPQCLNLELCYEEQF